MHKALEIRNAVFAKLQALEGTVQVKKVTKGAQPANDYPSVSVLLGDDTPATKDSTFTNWDLTVYTDVFIRSTSEDVDAQMLDIRNAIELQLLSDPSQGLGFVFQTDALGQQDPERSDASDQYTSATRLAWHIKYRAPTVPSL
jgi:hypothetical protein